MPDGEITRMQAPAVAEPSDDLGAGDVFAAAFFIALHEGHSPARAAAYGNAAAAIRIERTRSRRDRRPTRNRGPADLSSHSPRATPPPALRQSVARSRRRTRPPRHPQARIASSRLPPTGASLDDRHLRLRGELVHGAGQRFDEHGAGLERAADQADGEGSRRDPCRRITAAICCSQAGAPRARRARARPRRRARRAAPSRSRTPRSRSW